MTRTIDTNNSAKQLIGFDSQIPPINSLITVVLSTNAVYTGMVLGYVPQKDPRNLQLGTLMEGERKIKSIDMTRATGYYVKGNPESNRDGTYMSAHKVYRVVNGEVVNNAAWSPIPALTGAQAPQDDAEPVIFSNSAAAPSSSSSAHSSPAPTASAPGPVILRPAASLPSNFQDKADLSGSIANNFFAASNPKFAMTSPNPNVQSSNFNYRRNSNSPIFLPLSINNNVFNLTSSSAGSTPRSLSAASPIENSTPKQVPDLSAAYTSYKNAIDGLAEVIDASTKNIEVFRKNVDSAIAQLHKEFANITSDEADEVLTKDIRQLLDDTHRQLLDARERLVRSKAIQSGGDYTSKEMTSRLHADLSQSAQGHNSQQEFGSVKRQKHTHHMA